MSNYNFWATERERDVAYIVEHFEPKPQIRSDPCEMIIMNNDNGFVEVESHE